MTAEPLLRHVQMYDVARTAHFERALRSGAHTTILFASRRYDFDEVLARAVAARRAGVWGAFWYTLRNDVDVLETAEPLVARAAPRTLAAVFGTRLRRLIGGPRTRVVAYAIENKDPWQGHESLPLYARLKLRAQLGLLPLVWRQLDRIAYGTDQCAILYNSRFPAARRSHRRPEERTVAALPAAEAVGGPRDAVVTFLGDFSHRKGFDHVRQAWPLVAADRSDAKLVLMGKGGGVREAEGLAESLTSVRAVIDPDRDTLFAELAGTKVLVLPSQPRPRWREQVGLPIVEGLGRGCIIVTTSETGLAGWLSANGHYVISPPDDVDALAGALLRALADPRSPADVVAELPAVDGRVEAERWMLRAPEPATR
ncbi:glycosyltransferase [uncultured Microbacterium sp.]|uniref:Glycosyl transferase group 1 n=1 Tax=uncultured Microbacterium sp. TaxID=191216 RepID=A0A1Y5NXQ2_9MICO|nr:glycosyltransferase [uncultured Microbacterium sp.]SBS71212.1 Glycosyl transferase group 1 [uncultured Microbacterium sp.]